MKDFLLIRLLLHTLHTVGPWWGTCPTCSFCRPFVSFFPWLSRLVVEESMMERWTTTDLSSHCLWVTARMDLRAKEKGQQTARNRREGWPIDLIKLHPYLLCGHGGRISVSRLGLILVTQAGHLLQKMSKVVNLLRRCRLQRKRHKIIVVMAPVELKAPCLFNNSPLVFLIEKEFRDLGVEKPRICATYSTVFHKDWVMNSFSRARKRIWILHERFFFHLSNSWV